MSPLLLIPLGAVLGLVYGIAKGVGKTPGGKARYCAMCVLLGLVAGGLAYGAWIVLKSQT